MLFVGVPYFPLSVAARWVSVLPGWGAPLRKHGARAAVQWGIPLLISLDVHLGSALIGWGGPLAHLPSPRLGALLGGGYPLLLHPAAARFGHTLLCLGVPLRPLAAHHMNVLPGEGYPPSLSPLGGHAY